jgi:two-component system response regulator FixJ
MQAPQIVHVIDDDEGVREALCALLNAKGHVARAHESCEAFLNYFSSDTTLCIVADLRMKNMGGLQLQAQLLEQAIDLPFIVITGYGDVPSAVQALKSGAADFIEKPIDGSLFVSAVEKAARARLDRKTELDTAASVRKKISGLTRRERDVLVHLVAGNSNKMIAYELDISPRTVENHRSRLMVKMQAGSVAELVRMALAADTSPGADGSMRK